MTLNPHQFGPPTTPAQPEPEHTNFAHFDEQQVRQRQSNNYGRLKEIDPRMAWGSARYTKLSLGQALTYGEEVVKIRKQNKTLSERGRAIRMGG